MKLKANLSYLRAEFLGSMEVAPFDTMLISCQMWLIFFPIRLWDLPCKYLWGFPRMLNQDNFTLLPSLLFGFEYPCGY